MGDRQSPTYVYISVFSDCVHIALISSFVVQEQIPAVEFVHKYQHVFSLK